MHSKQNNINPPKTAAKSQKTATTMVRRSDRSEMKKQKGHIHTEGEGRRACNEEEGGRIKMKKNIGRRIALQ
ncbi:Multidrug resistance-associated protein 5 [Sesbania bispinosa]|nr:Multidrug resistance-associated protein 5 [Sesbania bispinosa]